MGLLRLRIAVALALSLSCPRKPGTISLLHCYISFSPSETSVVFDIRSQAGPFNIIGSLCATRSNINRTTTPQEESMTYHHTSTHSELYWLVNNTIHLYVHVCSYYAKCKSVSCPTGVKARIRHYSHIRQHYCVLSEYLFSRHANCSEWTWK